MDNATNESDLPPPSANRQPENSGPFSTGHEWNNGITRRSFLKRTGGATAGTFIAWNISSSDARGSQQDNHACSAGSADREWSGTANYGYKPSTYRASFGQSVGDGFANAIITIMKTLGAGALFDWISKTSDWESLVRSNCINAMKTFFQAQTQTLVFGFEGACVERTNCKHLIEPKITPKGQPVDARLGVNFTIGGFGISISGKLSYELIAEGATYFDNSLSEKVRIDVPTGKAKVAQDGQVKVSASGTLGGVITGQVSGSDSTDYYDIVIQVGPS